ncbi:unnamed protein product [Linum trigynum]|uniref:Uncharacterized protein n=1 Tax=Linum trigynum TaxID=586398 RepID=A0AAV2EE79_9ROSI
MYAQLKSRLGGKDVTMSSSYHMLSFQSHSSTANSFLIKLISKWLLLLTSIFLRSTSIRAPTPVNGLLHFLLATFVLRLTARLDSSLVDGGAIGVVGFHDSMPSFAFGSYLSGSLNLFLWNYWHSGKLVFSPQLAVVYHTNSHHG